VADPDGTGSPARSGGPPSAATRRHSELITAAVDAATHQRADSSALITALHHAPADLNPPGYQPLLVLLAAELSYADTIITSPDQPTGTDDGGGAAPTVHPVVPWPTLTT
jgi:hypothetical protein